jgi:hypothetical protein
MGAIKKEVDKPANNALYQKDRMEARVLQVLRDQCRSTEGARHLQLTASVKDCSADYIDIAVKDAAKARAIRGTMITVTFRLWADSSIMVPTVKEPSGLDLLSLFYSYLPSTVPKHLKIPSTIEDIDAENKPVGLHPNHLMVASQAGFGGHNDTSRGVVGMLRGIIREAVCLGTLPAGVAATDAGGIAYMTESSRQGYLMRLPGSLLRPYWDSARSSPTVNKISSSMSRCNSVKTNSSSSIAGFMTACESLGFHELNSTDDMKLRGLLVELRSYVFCSCFSSFFVCPVSLFLIHLLLPTRTLWHHIARV